MKKDDKKRILNILMQMKQVLIMNNDYTTGGQPVLMQHFKVIDEIEEIIENDECEFTAKETAEFAMNNPYEM